MGKTILKGALAGGLVLWVWSTFYWAISAIPVQGMKAFKDEAAVERVLREQAQGPGYYAIPTPFLPEGADVAEFGKERMTKISDDFFFAGAVRVGGLGSFPGQIGRSVLGNVVSAGIATALLLQTSGLSFFGRVAFVEGLALFAWVVGKVPWIIWWGTPLGFAVFTLLDFVVGWGLAGAALAWLVGDEG